MNTTGRQLTQKPAVIWYPISQHLHEKEEEQNAGPNDSDIYMLNSSTTYTHGHCGNYAPQPTDPKTPICQSNVYYTRNFCPISTAVNCQELNWEYENLKPKFKQFFLFADSRAKGSPKSCPQCIILSHLKVPPPLLQATNLIVCAEETTLTNTVLIKRGRGRPGRHLWPVESTWYIQYHPAHHHWTSKRTAQ